MLTRSSPGKRRHAWRQGEVSAALDYNGAALPRRVDPALQRQDWQDADPAGQRGVQSLIRNSAQIRSCLHIVHVRPRASTLRTLETCRRPPLAVRTPRAFSALQRRPRKSSPCCLILFGPSHLGNGRAGLGSCRHQVRRGAVVARAAAVRQRGAAVASIHLAAALIAVLFAVMIGVLYAADRSLKQMMKTDDARPTEAPTL